MNIEKLNQGYLMLGEWMEIANKFLKDKGIVLILGAVDTGKSILTLLLANYLVKRGRRVGIIDIDMGQSVLGPPTTIGMVVVNQAIEDLNGITPDRLYFVGSTSPVHHLLPTISGTKKLVEECKKKDSEIILLDTPGLVKGMMGQTFNENMIEIISPRHLIALQRERELEPLLTRFIHYEDINIYRLSPSPEVRKKAYFQRREIRERKFREYFQDSLSLTLRVDDLVVRGSHYSSGVALTAEEMGFIEKYLTAEVIYAEKTEEGIFIIVNKKTPGDADNFWEIKKRLNTEKIIFSEQEKYKNLLVSLEDRNGFVVSLGIIQEINFKRRTFSLLTPLKKEDLSLVVILKFGFIRVNVEGKELEKIYPGEI